MANDQKISQAAQLLQRAKRVVALTGAGISTPSGIPDFRSPGSGLWKRADPMEVASFWGFNAHPDSFYEWFKPLVELIVNAQPNPAHRALAELETMGKLRTVITQNIDDLHQVAGSQRVLQVHGHMRQATCIRCMHQVDATPLIREYLRDSSVPRCTQCGGPMKPNVVLFGEMLPVRVMYDAEQEAQQCDVMLVAGSSLEVAPAGDLPLVAKKHGAQIIIVNQSPTIADAHARVILRDDVAVALPKIVAQVKRA